MTHFIKLMAFLLMFCFATAYAAVPVNVNTADAKTLSDNMKGIGLKKANAIIEYRQKHGLFKTAEELAKVKGIGLKLVEQNRQLILVSDEVLRK